MASEDYSDIYESEPQEPPPGRSFTQVMFFVIIIATLPCYVIGAVLLAIAPEEENTNANEGTGTATVPALGLTLGTIQVSITPFGTATTGSNLGSTPGQFLTPIIRTNTPVFTLTPIPSASPPPAPTVPDPITKPEPNPEE